MVGEVLELPPIGKSDHVCQKWEVTVKDAIFKNTSLTRLNFKRANWARMREDVNNFAFNPSEQVRGMIDNFIAMVNSTKKENIPVAKPRSQKHRLPWMRGSRIKKHRSRRWKCWTRFKDSSLPRDYDTYKLERNLLNDLVREAKRRHERNLISDLKENPNLRALSKIAEDEARSDECSGWKWKAN